MARVPEGREVLQITVDTEVATALRVQAAIRRTTVGRLVEGLVRESASLGGQWTGRPFGAPDPASRATVAEGDPDGPGKPAPALPGSEEGDHGAR